MKTQEEREKMNIYAKMQKITEEMAVVVKGLNVQVNQKASYKAVSERDILDAVKPLESKYGVYSYPFSREEIEEDTLVKESEYNGKITKTNTLFMRIETVYRFVNIDNPSEFIDITSYGDGLDTGDKAPGKAMTYADKYALMKAYKISTGDDPDKEASPENGYSKIEPKATSKQITILEGYYEDENLDKLLKLNKIDKIEDLSMKKASELIGKIYAKKGNK